jgi:hypothetical protein
MASIPLNTFKNASYGAGTLPITSTPSIVYTAPAGVTSIILMAQVANITNAATTVTFIYNQFRQGQSILPVTIVNQVIVPPNDSLMLLGGRLILQTYDSISIASSISGSLHFVASILESANQ